MILFSLPDLHDKAYWLVIVTSSIWRNVKTYLTKRFSWYFIKKYHYKKDQIHSCICLVYIELYIRLRKIVTNHLVFH